MLLWTRIYSYVGKKKRCDSCSGNPGLLSALLLSSVQSFSCVPLFATPGTAACQASLSITNSQSLLKIISIESVMPSNHLTLCRPLSLCLQSSPASGSFTMSQFFTSGGQNIGVSAWASVPPMNIQDWFPLFIVVISILQIFLKVQSLTVYLIRQCSSLCYCQIF